VLRAVHASDSPHCNVEAEKNTWLIAVSGGRDLAWNTLPRPSHEYKRTAHDSDRELFPQCWQVTLFSKFPI
jgi:hypothetical protein